MMATIASSVPPLLAAAAATLRPPSPSQPPPPPPKQPRRSPSSSSSAKVAVDALEARVDALEQQVARLSLAAHVAAGIALCAVVYRFLAYIIAFGALALLIYIRQQKAGRSGG